MNTPIEPVGVEDLTHIRELDVARANLSMRLLDLEVEKIRVVAAGKRVKEELDGLFHRLAAERGIPDSTFMEINPRTGEVVTTPPDTPPKAAEPSELAPLES